MFCINGWAEIHPANSEKRSYSPNLSLNSKFHDSKDMSVLLTLHVENKCSAWHTANIQELYIEQRKEEGRMVGGEREERNMMQSKKQQMEQRRLSAYCPQ